MCTTTYKLIGRSPKILEFSPQQLMQMHVLVYDSKVKTDENNGTF